MKKGTSKSKGNTFERMIAKKLAKWYYNDENALVRNYSSGALATMRKDNLPPGDITQAKYFDRPWQFSCELKHHKDFKIEHLIFERKTSKVWKAWKQCLRDAGGTDLIPMLIWRQNFSDIYVAFETPDRHRLNELQDKAWHYTITKHCIIFTLEHFLQDQNIYEIITGEKL